MMHITFEILCIPLLGENTALFYSNMSLGHNSGLTYLTD